MSNQPLPTRAFVWMMPSQASLVRGVARACNLTIVGVGTSEQQRTREIAGSLEANAIDDVRALLGSDLFAGVNDLVWLAATGLFAHNDANTSPASPIDLRLIHQASERGAIVASLDPIPASVFDLAAEKRPTHPWINTATSRPALSVGPLVHRTPTAIAAHEHINELGEIQSVAINLGCKLGDASDDSLLFHACVALSEYLGTPEWVMGARSSTTTGTLTGNISVSCRTGWGSVGSIHVCAQLGAWDWRVVLAGEHGHLALDGMAFTRVSTTGETETFDASYDQTNGQSTTTTPQTQANEQTTDTSVEGSLIATPHADPLAIELIASHLRSTIAKHTDQSRQPTPPIDIAGALSIMHAINLSIRTGQPESPSDVRTTAGLA